MRTEVMWRPPGEERRQQRRSGAGRHITVLATQPQQIGGIALLAEVGRTGVPMARAGISGRDESGAMFKSGRPDCFANSKSRRWLQMRLATGFELLGAAR